MPDNRTTPSSLHLATIGNQYAGSAIGLLAACQLMGCGLAVPDIKEIWDADKPPEVEPRTPEKVTGTTQIEFEIKKRIYCDLKEAVQTANKIPLKEGPPGGKQTVQLLIPKSWGAQVSLSLQVDEISGLNPGITLNRVLPNAINIFGSGPNDSVVTPQSFNLGFGASLSSTATRIDKFDPYWSIAFLMIPDGPRSICVPGNDPLIGHGWTAASSSPFILESNLGIKDWLRGAMQVNRVLPSVGGGAGDGSAAPDTVSYEVKFVIVSNGSVTPTWTLVRLSANTGTGSLPFFSTGRTRTHDLIITMGPSSTQTNNAHLALQIGNAVSNANRAGPPPSQATAPAVIPTQVAPVR
jgi:hypothetical protein